MDSTLKQIDVNGKSLKPEEKLDDTRDAYSKTFQRHVGTWTKNI